MGRNEVMCQQAGEEMALLPRVSKSLPASLAISLMLFPSSAFQTLHIGGAAHYCR